MQRWFFGRRTSLPHGDDAADKNHYQEDRDGKRRQLFSRVRIACDHRQFSCLLELATERQSITENKLRQFPELARFLSR